MARSGVSREDVAAAIDCLLSNGDNPTNDAIRQTLGNTGSYSTINRLRQDIMAERDATSVTPVPELPESVSGVGGRLLRLVWEEACAQAAAAREVERRAFEEQKAVFEAQQTEMLGEIERLEQALEASDATSERHAAETSAAQASAQQTARELSAAEATIATLREELTHLRGAGTRLESWMERATTAEAELKTLRSAEAQA